MLGVSLPVLLVIALVLLAGAITQGVVGLGLALVSAPIVTLVAPQLMPDLILWLAFALPFLTLIRQHHDIDWHGLAWTVSWRVPGTVLGVAAVAYFSVRALSITVAVMVLLAVLLTWKAVVIPTTRSTMTGAGLLSGFAGTATGIGGPPVALLYQHREPAQIRSTLAVFFVAGAALSLAGLGIAGELEVETFQLALLMTPLLVIGVNAAGLIRRHVPERRVRPAVLLVCGGSAVVLLVRNLFG